MRGLEAGTRYVASVAREKYSRDRDGGHHRDERGHCSELRITPRVPKSMTWYRTTATAHLR